jgi:hypothetical protein
MGAALAYDNTLDSCAANRTGFTGSLVNAEIILEITPTIYPIDAGAVALDTLLKHVADTVYQPFSLRQRKGIRHREGMLFRQVKGFICVNISQTGQKGLVKQQRLELAVMRLEALVKHPRGKIRDERLGA